MTEHLPALNSRLLDRLNDRIERQQNELAHAHKINDLLIARVRAQARELDEKDAMIVRLRAGTANEEREG